MRKHSQQMMCGRQNEKSLCWCVTIRRYKRLYLNNVASIGKTELLQQHKISHIYPSFSTVVSSPQFCLIPSCACMKER